VKKSKADTAETRVENMIGALTMPRLVDDPVLSDRISQGNARVACTELWKLMLMRGPATVASLGTQ
jgi:hypothetical protein